MNEIVIGNLIGEGEFGKVYNCLYKENNAVLKLFKCTFQYSHKFVFNEINIIKSLNHENIIKYMYHTESEKEFQLIMEFGGDDLLTLLNERNFIEEETHKIVFDVIEAINYIHYSGICHRDIKLENVVFNGHICKLIDFGNAHRYTNNNTHPRTLKNKCGSKNYICPEISNKEIYDGYAADMWSFGIFTLLLYYKFYTFESSSMDNSKFMIFMKRNCTVTDFMKKTYNINIEVPRYINIILDNTLQYYNFRITIYELKFFVKSFDSTSNKVDVL